MAAMPVLKLVAVSGSFQCGYLLLEQVGVGLELRL